MEVISFSLFVSNIIRINLSPLCSYINKQTNKQTNKLQTKKLKDYFYCKIKLFPSQIKEGSDERIDSLSNVRTIPLSEER